MRIIILILLFSASLTVEGQNSTFEKQKRHIDSLLVLTEMNNDLAYNEVNGRDSIFGDYTANIHYKRSDKTIVKIESKSMFDTDGGKVFYYLCDNLIRATDNQIIYYYLDNSLVNELGRKVSTPETADLLRFQKSIKNLFMVLLSD
jgi:hypothetical protein